MDYCYQISITVYSTILHSILSECIVLIALSETETARWLLNYSNHVRETVSLMHWLIQTDQHIFYVY